MGLSNDIVSQFVELTKTSDKIQNEASVYGTIVTDGNNTYVKLDGSEQLTPIETTTNVAGGERVIVRIKDHKATVTGNITSPSVNNSQLDDVKDQITEFEIVIADRVTANEIVVGRIEADNVIINKKLTAIEGDFETIKADNVTITEKLTANEAEIKDLKVKKLDVESADLKFATIENLEATTIEVNTIKGNHAEFSETVTDKLEAIDADIKNLDTEKLNAKDADIKYANIDFANINMAAVEKLFTESGIIKNLVVGDTSITGELVGVTIKGDLIEANTLVADKLVVKGEDGLYYKLNTDGIKVEAEQTEYNSLNGSIITAKSITATKISVDDLVAFDATIGGFNISSNSIYSGVKSSVDNTTTGVYLDKNGQIAFGDSNNFLKFFKDTDGKWKLNISANSIKFSVSDKTVEEVIEDIDTKVKKTVKTVVDYYASSSSSTTKPTTGWGTTPPVWVNGKFIWAKTITTYTDGTSFESEPVCITGAKGDTGKPGVDGTSGVGISSVDVEYYLSTSSTALAGGSWSTNSPTWVDSKYMWSRTKTTTTDGKSTTSEPVCITGGKGATGSNGAVGQGVDSITEEYYLSTSKTAQTGGSWVTTPPTWSSGKYLWTRSKIIYKNPTETSYTKPVCDNSWEAVNEVEIGGRNLLPNSDFRMGLTGPFAATSSGGGTISVVNNTSRNTNVISMRGIKYFSTSKYLKIDFGTLTAGTYTFSLDYYVYNSTTSYQFYFDYDVAYNETIIEKFTKEKWTRVSNTFKVAKDGKVVLSLYTTDGANDLMDVDVCYPKLEKGNKATDWTLAPEDVDDKIDNITIGGRNILLDSENLYLVGSDYPTKTKREKGKISVLSSGIFNAYSTLELSKTPKELVGKEVIFGIDIKTTGLVNYGVAINLDYRANGYVKDIKSIDIQPNKNGEWVRYFIKIKGTSSESDTSLLNIKCGNAVLDLTGALIEYRNCMIEEGNKASSYSKAPEDIEDKIENLIIGGTNLLKNSDFSYKEPYKFWHDSTAGIVKGIYSDAQRGYDSFVKLTTNHTTSAGLIYVGMFSMSVGEKLTLSLEVNTDSAIKIGIAIDGSSLANGKIFDISQLDRWITLKATFTYTGINPAVRVYCANTDGVTRNWKLTHIKLERGEYATSWNKHPDDYIAEVNSLQDTMEGAFKDNILSESEKKAINQSLQIIKGDLSEADNTYLSLTSNLNLIGTPKTNLTNAKVSYNSAYNSLVSFINTALEAPVITDAMKNSINSAFNTYRTALGGFNTRVQEAIDSINSKKVDDVQIGSTNLLRNTALERDTSYFNLFNGVTRDTSVKCLGTNTFKYDVTGLTANAWYCADPKLVEVIEGEKYSASAYVNIADNTINDTAVFALEIQFWNASGTRISSVSKVVSDIRNKWQLVKLENITAPVGTAKANCRVFVRMNGKCWVGRLKLEKGTKVTDWTPSPEDVSDNITIGGRNLLLKSNVKYSNSNYGIASYLFGNEKLSDGEEFTIQIKGKLNSGKTSFAIYNSGGIIQVLSLTESNNKNGIYTATGKWIITKGNATAKNTHIVVYATPFSTTAVSSIEWVKLEKGNKATDWTPAPEDIDSQISVITNRVTDAESSIEQLDTSITNKVWQTDIDKTIVEVNNRGENLVTNGNASYKDNTNFKSFIYRGNIRGISGYPSFEKAEYCGVTDEKIYVDTTKDYRFCYEIKAVEETTGVAYGVMVCYDIDGLEISPRHCLWMNNTTTTLAKPLNPGDTVVYLSDLTNWNIATESRYYQRGFIIWNYSDSTGYTYPEETYSRNSYKNLYADDTKVNKSAKTITLSSAWNGPLIPAGTKLSQSNDGSTYEYLGIIGNVPPKNFIRYDVPVPSRRFRSGTVSVKLGIMSNPKVYISNIHFGLDKVNSSDLSLVTTEVANISKRTATLETNVDGITSKVTKLETTTSTINGNIKDHETRIQTTEQKVTASGVITTIQEAINKGTNSLTTMQFILDKNGATIKNGALKILNNAGDFVLHGDTSGNLIMRGVFEQFQNGVKSVDIKNNAVNLYDWSRDGDLVGGMIAVIGNTDGRGKAMIYGDQGNPLVLGYCNANRDTYYDVITIDDTKQANGNQTVIGIYDHEALFNYSALHWYGLDKTIPLGKITVTSSSNDLYILGKQNYNSVYIGEMTSSANTYVGYARINASGLYVWGDIKCSGPKTRLVPTAAYDGIKLNAYETADCYFGDIGEGTIGEDGLCYVYIDPLLLETINTKCAYQVFVQAYGDGKAYPIKREETFFVIKGTPGLKFGWEFKAKQRDYETERLEREKIELMEQDSGESFLDYIDKESDYDDFAIKYLKDYEEELIENG